MQPLAPPLLPPGFRGATLALKNQEEDPPGASASHKPAATTAADAPTTNITNPAGPDALRRIRSILDGGIHSTYDAIID